MIETRCLKDVVIFFQTILSFALSRKIILLYTFLVISFAQCKEYMICLISFIKFSDVLPAFAGASAIGNL